MISTAYLLPSSSYCMACKDNGYTFSLLSRLTFLRCFSTSSQHYPLPNLVNVIPKPPGFLESCNLDVVSAQLSDNMVYPSIIWLTPLWTQSSCLNCAFIINKWCHVHRSKVPSLTFLLYSKMCIIWANILGGGGANFPQGNMWGMIWVAPSGDALHSFWYYSSSATL